MRKVLTHLRDGDRTETMLGVFLAGAALLRFYALSAESFWFDEAYSVWVARHSVGWHIELSTQRIFPPLYYLLLHFWLRLGSSEFAVRSLSVLIGLASIGAAYGLARGLFDRRVGLLSALLLAVSPLHIWYSQEARMYILVAALGLCSAYFMLLALRGGKFWHWVAYVLITAMLMNAHYFAIFLVPFQNAYALYMLLRRQVDRTALWCWVASQLSVAVLSVIGLAGIFSAESGYWWGLLDTWHGAPGIADLLGLMFEFSMGMFVQGRLIYWGTLSAFGSCILWGLLSAIGVRAGAPRRGIATVHDRRDIDSIVFVLLYLLVPLGTVFLLSQFRSFWVLRYIFPFLPPFCILVAYGLSRMQLKLLWMMVGLMVLANLWAVADIYRDEQKENWRAAVQHMSAHEEAGDVILLVDEDIWLPFEHYYRGSTRRVGISRVVDDRDLLAARVGMLLPSYDRIWLVLSHTDNWMVRDFLLSSPATELVSEESFAGVQVELYVVHTDERAAAIKERLVSSAGLFGGSL